MKVSLCQGENDMFCTLLTHLDALHKSRLLIYEERPFKRLTKRLLAPDSILVSLPQQDYDQLREDIQLDFCNFESSIVRTQFLFSSNESERKRYATEKLRIEHTAQEVRDNTAELRVHLEEAQKTLAVRKTWDDLAEKITNNRSLKPRDEQQANLEKLHNEIAELERESREYALTWAERRAQFGKIIEEGMALRRQIRDEKEEVERREGMEEHEDGDDADGGSHRGRTSAVGTPRPEAGGATPMHLGADGDSGAAGTDGLLNSGAKSPLGRAASQNLDISGTPQPGEGDDVDMEEGEFSGSEGQADDDGENGRGGGRGADSMDTS
jgi:hypothetical protein